MEVSARDAPGAGRPRRSLLSAAQRAARSGRFPKDRISRWGYLPLLSECSPAGRSESSLVPLAAQEPLGSGSALSICATLSHKPG